MAEKERGNIGIVQVLGIAVSVTIVVLFVK